MPVRLLIIAAFLTTAALHIVSAEISDSTDQSSSLSDCYTVDIKRVVGIDEVKKQVQSLLSNELDPRNRVLLGQAYLCLAKAYLIVVPIPNAGESKDELLESLREELAVISYLKALSYDPPLEHVLFPKKQVPSVPQVPGVPPFKLEKVLKNVDDQWTTIKAKTQQRSQWEQELEQRLNEAEEMLKRKQEAVERQSRQIEEMNRAAEANEKKRRFTISIAEALAFPEIRDRDGEPRLHALSLVFIGRQMRPNGTRHQVCLGIAGGIGLAADTPAAFVIGPALQLELSNRVGILGGFGWRLSTRDRARQPFGVAIGISTRLWSFKPKW